MDPVQKTLYKIRIASENEYRRIFNFSKCNSVVAKNAENKLWNFKVMMRTHTIIGSTSNMGSTGIMCSAGNMGSTDI